MKKIILIILIFLLTGCYDYKELNDLSILSLNISEFIYYNLKAVMKILKKYDKKVIGSEFKHLYIKINYIQAKLEEQNSDILYLIKFKMIDEINLIKPQYHFTTGIDGGVNGETFQLLKNNSMLHTHYQTYIEYSP